MKNAYLITILENDIIEPFKVCLNETQAKKFVINSVKKYTDPSWVQDEMEEMKFDTIEALCEFYEYDPNYLGYGYYPIPLID